MNILNFKIDITKVNEGLSELSNTTRLELYDRNKGIFDTLDYDDDKPFLLPDLFYCIFASHKKLKTIDIEQLLCGYSCKSEINVLVISNDEGYIYLPNIGYLLIEPLTEYKLIRENAGEISLFKDGKKLLFELKPFIYLSDTEIQLRLTKNYSLINSGAIFNEPITKTVKDYKHIIETAWNKLTLVSPDFSSLIKKTTKDICLFNCRNQNSFASLSSFGTAFINVENQGIDEIFFIDDISHQCGHIIFYALTLNMQIYFIDSPKDSLSIFTGLNDKRSLYDTFHGLFTYTSTLDSLTKCYESTYFLPSQKIELLGRIGFYMNKFKYDIKFMENPKIFSDIGKDFFSMFVKSYDDINCRYCNKIVNLRFTQQPYFYNHMAFLSENKSLILCDN